MFSFIKTNVKWFGVKGLSKNEIWWLEIHICFAQNMLRYAQSQLIISSKVHEDTKCNDDVLWGPNLPSALSWNEAGWRQGVFVLRVQTCKLTGNAEEACVLWWEWPISQCLLPGSNQSWKGAKVELSHESQQLSPAEAGLCVGLTWPKKQTNPQTIFHALAVWQDHWAASQMFVWTFRTIWCNI